MVCDGSDAEMKLMIGAFSGLLGLIASVFGCIISFGLVCTSEESPSMRVWK